MEVVVREHACMVIGTIHGPQLKGSIMQPIREPIDGLKWTRGFCLELNQDPVWRNDIMDDKGYWVVTYEERIED